MRTATAMVWAVCWAAWLSAPARAAFEEAEPAEATGTVEAAVEADRATDSRANTALDADEVIVTATRSAKRRFDLPYTADVIDQQQMRERSYRTVPQALRDVPGVMVQETSPGQGSPYIRGFTSMRNVFMVDGVRLNNSVFRQGPNQYWNTIDPFLIDRVEIVKGPSSVLYGSDAIGGTVNAITRNPTTYGEGINHELRGYFRASSAENSYIGRGEADVTFDQHTGLLFGGGASHFGNLRAGDPSGSLDNTGYDNYTADFKIEHWLNENVRIVAAHQRLRINNAPRTHQTIFAKPFAGSTVGSDRRRDLDQEREMTYVQLHAENLEGFIDTLRVSISHQHQGEERDRIRGSGAQEFQGFDVETLGFWIQAESDTPIGRLTYGLEYYRDWVSSFSSTNPIQGPVADDATYDLLGVYIQDEITVTDRLTVLLGGRFNYAAADADSVADPVTGDPIAIRNDWTSIVGSARAIYAVVPERLNVFGGVSQGFRAPNLSDLSRFDTARTDEFEIPAPGLDPEYYLSYEVGVKAKGERYNAEVSYFYTDISDQIIRFPTGDTNLAGDFEITKDNAGEGHMQGIEAGAAYRILPEVTLFGNITYLDGEVTTFPTSTSGLVSEYYDRLMPLTGQVGLRYDAANLPVWIETAVMMADDADRLSTRDKGDTSRIPPGGTPGYAVWMIRGGWRVNDHVTLHAAIDNVLDEDYRVHGSGQNMPGRNFILGAEIKF